jgi:hypothetical protein
MVMQTIPAEGAVVYWTCGPTPLQPVNRGLEALTRRRVEPRADNSALQNALQEYARRRIRKKDVLVRANLHPSNNGYSVVLEWKGVDRCDHAHAFTARVGANGVVQVIPAGAADADELSRLFLEYKALASAQAIGKCLTGIVADLDGVCLRQAGGIYWLPEPALPKWADVAEVVERAGPNAVETVRTAMDEGTARALKTAITREIGAAADQMFEEMAGGLGEKAAANRLEIARALEQRIQRYSDILQDSLSELREKLHKVQHALTVLAMQAVG